jgi:hypothetical protein
MTTDRALILLVAGAALSALTALASASAIVGIAGAALCLVAFSPLVQASDAFGSARFGAVLTLIGSVLLIAEAKVGIAAWLVLLGLLLVITGSCAGLRELVPAGFRRDAAGRISGWVLLIMLALALLLALDQAGVGPGWVSGAITGLRLAAGVLIAWFIAYVAINRTVVPARVS